MAHKLFLTLNVIAESENDKEISSSIMPIPDDIVFCLYHFEELQVDHSLWSCIYHSDSPHKNSEDSYKEHGFWYPIYQIFLNKNKLADSRHYRNLAQSTY